MEISWEKWNAAENAAADVRSLLEVWANVGGAGCDKHLDGYLYGVLHDHVQTLAKVMLGEEWRDGHFQAPEVEEPAAAEPVSSAVHAELDARMTALEEAAKNPPPVTAKNLEDWRARLSIIAGLVHGATCAGEMLRKRPEVESPVYGVVTLMEKALDEAENDLAMLGMDIADAVKAKPQEADAEAAD